MTSLAPTKSDVREFWDQHPCGRKFQSLDIGTKEFFDAVESHRYRLEPHILEIVSFKSFKGKKVLEVGCGLGTDGIHFARSGADYFAIDLTPTSIDLVEKRFKLEGQSGHFQVADAESMPFESNSFDCVYSHGVIHHTPNIDQAVSEIYRVLKPGGRAMVMVYHKNSINYLFNIMVFRKLGIWLLRFPGGIKLVRWLTGESKAALEEHKKDFKRMGISYLSSQIFLSRNTDGAGNPLSRVYTKAGLASLFSRFSNIETKIRYFNKHRIPIIRSILPVWLENWLSKKYGWHLYIFCQK